MYLRIGTTAVLVINDVYTPSSGYRDVTRFVTKVKSNHGGHHLELSRLE